MTKPPHFPRMLAIYPNFYCRSFRGWRDVFKMRDLLEERVIFLWNTSSITVYSFHSTILDLFAMGHLTNKNPIFFFRKESWQSKRQEGRSGGATTYYL
jgi:hypothetical protein